MHKRLFNEALIKLTISPAGPILIKAGEGAADPTQPDMSFVRTNHNGREAVYLPGSSLKGVIRAHCERLARTVEGKGKLACDPLDDRSSCSKRLEKEGREWPSWRKHAKSCFLCQLFGNTSFASHFLISDAYPEGEEPRREERNGVAIDRVFGSVAVGPFNYETVTSGTFPATLHFKNFTLAQLGLVALALRDLAAKRMRLGFGKSRGLGLVSAEVNAMTLRYPSCELKEGRLHLLGGDPLGEANSLVGVGKFAESFPKDENYDYPKNDVAGLPKNFISKSDVWDGVEFIAPQNDGRADWEPLGRVCAAKWKEVVEDASRR
jgi:CRISPR/Cas system CSM-associated protein Csm3 (group 7 of RAMP superfamily)